jgi:hypothetical protein
LAHLACIALGARAFRLMGAGESMARAVEAGKIRPVLVTLGIATVLAVWASYALSAAGHIAPLPLTGPVLVAISTVFLIRATCFFAFRRAFPENSNIFWWVSSAICLAIGTLYAWGTALAWARF